MAEEKETKEVKEVKEEKYSLVYVPTGQALAIQTPEGETLSTEEAMVEILNVIRQIKKAI